MPDLTEIERETLQLSARRWIDRYTIEHVNTARELERRGLLLHVTEPMAAYWTLSATGLQVLGSLAQSMAITKLRAEYDLAVERLPRLPGRYVYPCGCGCRCCWQMVRPEPMEAVG